MNARIESLVREFLDLLDSGAAGVYELRWLAQTIEGGPVPADEPALRLALSRVLEESGGSLIWAVWPNLLVGEAESRDVDQLPAEAGADPEADVPLLVVVPRSSQSLTKC